MPNSKTQHSKVLLVDDERSIRITLGEFLRSADYEVEIAEDAKQAIEMLSSENFDVVVTDIVMPRITGVKLLEAIREKAPHVQVILMTGKPTVETASIAVRADAFDYLIKPISKENLIKTVSNAAKLKFSNDERIRLAEENRLYQENLEQLVEERTARLEESEARYQLLSDATFEAIFLSDKGICFGQNKTAEEMFGYTLKEAQGMSGTKWIVPEHRDIVIKNMLSGYEEAYKVTALRKDNSTFPCEIQARMMDFKGKRIRITALRDITKRVKAEKALQKNIQQLETLHTVTTALSTSLELDKVLELILAQIKKAIPLDSGAIFLYEKGELKVVADIGITPSVKGLVFSSENELFKELAKTRKPLILENVKEDSRFKNWGKSKNMESWVGIPLFLHDTLIGFLTIDSHREDVQYTKEQIALVEPFAAQAAQAIYNARLFSETQNELNRRMQAEKALREEKDMFQQYLDIAGVIIVAINKAGNVTLINKKGCETLGYSEKEIIGKQWIENFIPKRLRDVVITISQQLLAGKTETIEYFENPILTKSGEEREIAWHNTLIKDAESNITGHLSSGEDITERKKAEAAAAYQLSELETLYESGLAISGLLDPKEIANRLIAVLEEKLEWHHVAIRSYNATTNELKLLGLNLTGVEKEEIQKQISHLNKMVSSPNEGLSGWVIKNKKSILINDLTKNKRYVASYADIKSGLYVPMMVGNKVIGSIAVESTTENAFSAENERLLNILANQAAISLENARLYLDIQRELNERILAEKRLSQLNLQLEELVTERTAEIKAAHQRMALATAVAGIGIWEREAGDEEQFWNDRMYHIYDTSPEEFTPTTTAWREMIHPEDRHRVSVELAKTLEQGLPYSTEYRIITANGSLRYIVSEAIALFNEKTETTKLLGVNMDITRIKQAEETLRLSNQELERSLRVKDEFLANMSHELRTPLNAILGLSESLEEQIAGSLNEKQQKYVHIIYESGQHLLEMINDILDLAKIEAGETSLEMSKISIHSVCQASVRMIKQLAQDKDQKISISIDEEINLIWADERRLKQMIINLLSNAVKFTPQGGEIGLEVKVKHSPSTLLITVWDTGIGISEKDIDKLFQPFVQLDSKLNRASGGTGLGLTLVSQMARLHGGRVEVDSAPGRGSRFTLILPWDAASATDSLSAGAVASAAETSSPTGEKPKTVLLVEDTEASAIVVADYLKSAGFRVPIAKNGSEAISLTRKLRPDLILMDVMMPGMDGIKATQQIKSVPSLAKIPIIGLTALATKDDYNRCLAAGMEDSLSKPIKLGLLLTVIKSHLSLEGDNLK